MLQNPNNYETLFDTIKIIQIKARELERNSIYEKLKLLKLYASLSKEEEQLINKIITIVLNPKISVVDIVDDRS